MTDEEMVEVAVEEAPKPKSKAARRKEEGIWVADDLEPYSQALFGQPRSVFVGARRAGFIADSVTKTEAAAGVQQFMEYGKETG